MSTFQSHFLALDTALSASRTFWQFLPFEMPGYYWQASPLVDWLTALNDDEVEKLKADPIALADALQPYIPQAQRLLELADDSLWRIVSKSLQVSHKRGLESGVPGRKWHQIDAFSRGFSTTKLPFLEWCAGKGHLGRLLSDLHKQPVTSLEWQASLCEQGEEQAKKHQLPIKMVCGDALGEAAAIHLEHDQHAVALHACGELHLQLLRLVAQKETRAVTISPCCYHLIPQSTYHPLSALGSASDLVLSKHDLRLPLQETVTAPSRIEKLRHVEMSFRLGFDLLQRDLRQRNEYLPIPNVKKSLFNEGFEGFCHWAAEKKGVVLNDDIDFPSWLVKGQIRFKQVERMELVRQLFRRPLELWLVLDRVLFLEQHGYQISLQRLCEKSVTPRNYFLHAIKTSSPVRLLD